MPKRPFYVQPNGECVPLEGDWRVARLDDGWYVLGHHSVVPCGSERAARRMLEQLVAERDVDRLASEAIDTLDPVPDGWEADGLGEADLV